jgi:hypothetical protein
MSITSQDPTQWEPIYPCVTDGYTSDLVEQATTAARTLLWALTGRRFGVFTTTGEQIRFPACKSRAPGIEGTLYARYQEDVDTCLRAVLPRSPIRSVEAVRRDGVVLASTQYWTEGNHILVKGLCPSCDGCAPPLFEVDYTSGIVPDAIGRMALGEVACELMVGFGGGACKLSTRAVSISRQGVTIDLEDATALLEGGLLGLTMADAFIRSVNPARLVRASRVLSPDVGRSV